MKDMCKGANSRTSKTFDCPVYSQFLRSQHFSLSTQSSSFSLQHSLATSFSQSPWSQHCSCSQHSSSWSQQSVGDWSHLDWSQQALVSEVEEFFRLAIFKSVDNLFSQDSPC